MESDAPTALRRVLVGGAPARFFPLGRGLTFREGDRVHRATNGEVVATLRDLLGDRVALAEAPADTEA